LEKMGGEQKYPPLVFVVCLNLAEKKSNTNIGHIKDCYSLFGLKNLIFH
jgi:hypothetical protein